MGDEVAGANHEVGLQACELVDPLGFARLPRRQMQVRKVKHEKRRGAGFEDRDLNTAQAVGASLRQGVGQHSRADCARESEGL